MPDNTTFHFLEAFTLFADNDLKVHCIGCDDKLQPNQVYMTIRLPKQRPFYALCQSCTRACALAISDYCLPSYRDIVIEL